MSSPRATFEPIISLSIQPGAIPFDRPWLEERIGEASRLVSTDLSGKRVSSIAIRIVDDAAMTVAHQRWRGEPTTTDVLTFVDESIGERGARELSFDLLLCIDEAARNAAGRGHSLERELLLYALHGLLHGLGHDDADPQRFALMHAEEDRILRAMGVGATFESAMPPRSDGETS